MTEVNRPTFAVYSAIPSQNSGEDLLNIGLAYPHHDKKGFDVVLQALPLNPKLVLREIDRSQPQFDPRESNDHPEPTKPTGPLSLKEQVDAYERALIERCLREASGQIRAVMERLDIPRRTLSDKMTRLGIDRRCFLNKASADVSREKACPPSPSRSMAIRNRSSTRQPFRQETRTRS